MDRISPQGYSYEDDPKSDNPFWNTEEGGGGGGGSLPEGGTTGQVLTKRSNNDGDADWQDVPQEIPHGGTAGQVLMKYGDGDNEYGWDREIPYGGTAGQVLTKYGDGDNEYGWENAGSTARGLTWIGEEERPEAYSDITSANQIRRTTAELQAWKQDEYEVALPYNEMLIDNVAGNTVTDNQSGNTISVEIVPVTSPIEIWDDQTETLKKYGLMKQTSDVFLGVGGLKVSSNETFLRVKGKSNDNIENLNLGMSDEDMHVWGNTREAGYDIDGTCTLNYDAGGVDYHKSFNLKIRGFNIPLTTTDDYKKLVAI